MPEFSKVSLARIATCEQALQDVAHELIKYMDVAVLCGHRNKEDQDLAFAQHRSQTPWPQSRHNAEPSQALDIAPVPVKWPSNEIMKNPDAQVFARYAYMIGLARGIASQRGIDLRSGIDWDSDGEIADNSFNDLPHLEIRKK